MHIAKCGKYGLPPSFELFNSRHREMHFRCDSVMIESPETTF